MLSLVCRRIVCLPLHSVKAAEKQILAAGFSSRFRGNDGDDNSSAGESVEAAILTKSKWDKDDTLGIVEKSTSREKALNFENDSEGRPKFNHARNAKTRKGESLEESLEGFDVKAKKAAKKVAAKAGDQAIKVEEDLMQALDSIVNKKKPKRVVKRDPRGVDLSQLENLDLTDAMSGPRKRQGVPRQSKDKTSIDLSVLEKVNLEEMMSVNPKRQGARHHSRKDSEDDTSRLSQKKHSKSRERTRNTTTDDDLKQVFELMEDLEVGKRSVDKQSRSGFDLNEGSRLSFKSLEEMLSQPKLGIFTNKVENSTCGRSLKLWPTLTEKHVIRNYKFEPLNWWDECIQWTEQGRLWHFPIDNEQGLDEEADVDFTEHIFLEKHIESWCPKEGPIQHFMEVVLVGLSKNPYLSVQEKVDNIEWFRKYFEKHEKLLTEINAFGPSSAQGMADRA